MREVQRVAREALAFAPIDILINNAGHIVKRVHWTELDPAHLDRVFGLNYRAPLYLTQLLSPGMIERGKGVILNTLSTAFVSGGTDTVYAYASAKGALWTLDARASAVARAARGARAGDFARNGRHGISARAGQPGAVAAMGGQYSTRSDWSSRPRLAKWSRSWCPTRRASSSARRST